ncbi:MAG: hypothetical protein ABJF10_05255 [Chthoniobacter sp.]|uniref:hypothetical protein n=1 Tax=Chthoniobacter sp. TaxID=2510640 RepID=UPI0032A6D336
MHRPIFRLRLAGAIFLPLIFALRALAADSDWHSVTGAWATFQAPAAMVRSTDGAKAGEGSTIEIFECPSFSVSFESGSGALPRELQTDLEKAVAAWSTEARKNWKVNMYLEDEHHLAYAAIRTANDPSFHDHRPGHLSFGLAAGEKPFSIHIRFQRPEDLAAIERLLKSLKLRTL